MIAKIILVVSFLLFILLNIFGIEKREYIKPTEQLFFVNPLNFKMGTNLYSSFYADKFWLMSFQIDEGQKLKYGKINFEKFYKGFETMNYLDPNFTQPIVFAVSYLIINEKKYDLGMKLLNEAIKKSPKNPKLLFQKLIYITTYNPKKTDVKEALKIGEELYKQNIIFMGAIKISDFVAELIDHNSKTKKEKIKNLVHLYKFAKNKEIKKDLETILKKYKKVKNEKK